MTDRRDLTEGVKLPGPTGPAGMTGHDPCLSACLLLLLLGTLGLPLRALLLRLLLLLRCLGLLLLRPETASACATPQFAYHLSRCRSRRNGRYRRWHDLGRA